LVYANISNSKAKKYEDAALLAQKEVKKKY
jgi:hypothetical protein